jgi:hypothetical protein
MSDHPFPGTNAALQEVVDRILRLTLHDSVISALVPLDLEALQYRAQEALQTLALTGVDASCEAANRQVDAATPALCGLAVECVNIVERAELTTGPARLVAAGCEVLAGLLLPRVSEAHAQVAASPYQPVNDTLEELSDQLDFLALEVYCGLGRLEGAVCESDELPIVPDHMFDRFESYWGSIEHRQALQEVSAWLLCVIFRAIGYSDVTARNLMQFANHDLLCLCALVRGVLGTRPGAGGLPHDAPRLQGIALNAVCGLTAPELAFPYYSETSADTIEDQNRILSLYREVLCAAFVETGLLQAALDCALLHGQSLSGDNGQPLGVRFLGFLAAVVKQAGDVHPTPDDPSPPAYRLRDAVVQRADRLGSLLHVVSYVPLVGSAQRQLITSCAELVALISTKIENSDDAFTLECRMLLSTWLENGRFEEEIAATLFALAALAANVGDFEVSRHRLAELIGVLPPEDRGRVRSRCMPADATTLIRYKQEVIELFEDASSHVETSPVALSVQPMAPEVKPIVAPTAAPGLRDLVQNAPERFRCALDQKLLCDPVVSPGGIVFERSTLARWLQTHDSVCPITSMPLRLEDCMRSPEIRKQVTEWARTAGRERKPKKKKHVQPY